MNWWMMETAVALLIWAGVFFLLGIGLGAVLWRKFKSRQHAFMDERNDLKERNSVLEAKVVALEEARGGVLKDGESGGEGAELSTREELAKLKLRITTLERTQSAKDEEINALLGTIEDREQETVFFEKGMARLKRRMRLQGLDVELPERELETDADGGQPASESLLNEEKEADTKIKADAVDLKMDEVDPKVDEVDSKVDEVDSKVAEVDSNSAEAGDAEDEGENEVEDQDGESVEDEPQDDFDELEADFEVDPDAETAPVPPRAKLESMLRPGGAGRENDQEDASEDSPVVEIIKPGETSEVQVVAAGRALPVDNGNSAQVDAKLGKVFPSKPGDADDLCQIRGIGAATEKKLNRLGVYTYDQIASWSPEVSGEFSNRLSFKDRIDSEDWIGQARKKLKS